MDPDNLLLYTRLTRRPVSSAPMNAARLLLGGTLPPVDIDDAAAAAHEAAQHTVQLCHLLDECTCADILDEEMLLDQLLEYGVVDSLVLVRKNEYVATFATAAAAAAASDAEAEAAASAAPTPSEPPPSVVRLASAPASLTPSGALPPMDMPNAAADNGAELAPPWVGGGLRSGGGGCLSSGGCMSGGLSKKKTLKRVGVSVGGAGAPMTPSSGRRVISFGTMDDPASAAPERRGKFTLPGGRPAFSPGWNDESALEVTDAESEMDDTRGDAISFSITVDERTLIDEAPVLLSTTGGFATLRLPQPASIEPCHTRIACVLVGDLEKENGGAPPSRAHAHTSPPMTLSAWADVPSSPSSPRSPASGGALHRRSLTVHCPGFTVCFDAEGVAAAWDRAAHASVLAAPADASSNGVQLVAVRLMRSEASSKK